MAVPERRWTIAYLLMLFTTVLSSDPCAAAPLKEHPSNGRYFMDSTGKAIYLTGAINANAAQGGLWGANSSYSAALDYFTANNLNLMRWWIGERVFDGSGQISPFPWPRTGPGTAVDGKPKFDLTRHDDAFFSRIRQRAIEAGNRGIYISFQFFQGWSNVPDAWSANLFRSANNINGIDGSDGSGGGTTVHTLQNAAIVDIQKAYIRRVVDTLNDLDNVLYEICNECHQGSGPWQQHLVDYLKSYQAGKPKQHPVGMSMTTFDNSYLFSSNSDWLSPGTMAYADPGASDGSRPFIIDTDHIWGCVTDPRRDWAWKMTTRGYNSWYIYCDMNNITWYDNATMHNMGKAHSYMKRMDLSKTFPRGDLCSSGYCVAEAGKKYLVYLPNGGSVTVNLSGGDANFNVEWYDTVNERTVAGTATQSGSRTLSAPFSGPAALFIEGTGGTPPPPPPPPPACAKVGVDSFEACYYDNPDFTALNAAKNVGGVLDLNFGMGSPDPAIGPDTFSATFRGSYNFEATDYLFTVAVDDGVRLYIDGALVIDQWKVQAATQYSATRAMTAGRHEIKVDYYENLGDASIKLQFGKVVVTPPPGGSTDVNRDGATNITDVQLAINQSLGLSACSAGDVNGDGQCTILDVQRIVNAALGV